MRVKLGYDGGLELDGDMEQEIDEAFNDGRYVEAFTLLHAWINFWMDDLLELDAIFRKGLGGEQLKAFVDERDYSWGDSLRLLQQTSIINEGERKRLVQFNELRNQIIHRLIPRSYKTNLLPEHFKKVTPEEAFEGFQEGKALVDMLRSRMQTPVPPNLRV